MERRLRWKGRRERACVESEWQWKGVLKMESSHISCLQLRLGLGVGHRKWEERN
jgi:hypothetical protein